VAGTLAVQLAPAAGPAGKKLTAQTTFGPIEPDQAVEVSAEFPGRDLAASGWHVTYAASYGGLVQTLEDNLLPSRTWQVIGPFPNPRDKGFRHEFAPEKGVDPQAVYAAGPGKPLRWQPVGSSTSGFVSLSPLFDEHTTVCAYAAIYVKSPTARKAVIWAGSFNGYKIWLNGSQVFSVLRQRKARPGQDRVAVQLKEGWNEVLLKVPQRQGDWGFYFDLRGADGQPLADLRYAPTRPGTP
jgi:hypothetical protein